MRFFHLSDLHIGKQFYGYPLLEDQEWILKEILQLVRERRPDAVLISGDVYDKSVPAAEAVAVFDHFLGELASIEPRIPVLVISGNHDSGERLSFAGSILENEQVYIMGNAPKGPKEWLKKVTLEDEWGKADIYMLPFLKPGMVKNVFNEGEEPETYQEAVSGILSRENVDENHRNILMAHQFFTAGGEGPKLSESETVSVGGIDQVDTKCLDGFDYVALGHIHRPQSMGREAVRYCGTPLKYSVSEWNQIKSLTEVEIGEKGTQPQIHLLELHPLRDVRVIRGKLEDILLAAEGEVSDDYVSVTLTDEQDPYQPKERLEAIFPHILEVKMDNSRTSGLEWLEEETETITDPKEVFERFFFQMQGREMDEEEKLILQEVFESVGEAEG
ncbi:MAG: exonuclease SbcCD subunit D [Clostridia bacterium]|nr:exonuclease SbcCD subunit D [Clostridia bacterium]NCC42332.1 exonuclease SbcCD subunit D [Clostridia bacterium]